MQWMKNTGLKYFFNSLKILILSLAICVRPFSFYEILGYCAQFFFLILRVRLWFYPTEWCFRSVPASVFKDYSLKILMGSQHFPVTNQDSLHARKEAYIFYYLSDPCWHLLMSTNYMLIKLTAQNTVLILCDPFKNMMGAGTHQAYGSFDSCQCFGHFLECLGKHLQRFDNLQHEPYLLIYYLLYHLFIPNLCVY